jgi:hypothetical protein
MASKLAHFNLSTNFRVKLVIADKVPCCDTCSKIERFFNQKCTDCVFWPGLHVTRNMARSSGAVGL